ncbi:MAG: hypothetical protein M1817_006319 [Caeruleum heppii]|nr:MAG: hypothetical protein M1817_006319 [Caeruleum heppii]
MRLLGAATTLFFLQLYSLVALGKGQDVGIASLLGDGRRPSKAPLLHPSERHLNESPATTVPLLGFRPTRLSNLTTEKRGPNDFHLSFSQVYVDLTNDTYLYGVPIEAEVLRAVLQEAIAEAARHRTYDGDLYLKVSKNGWDFVLRSTVSDAGFTYQSDFRSIASILLDHCRNQKSLTRTFVGYVRDPNGSRIGELGMIPSNRTHPATLDPGTEVLPLPPGTPKLHRRFKAVWQDMDQMPGYRFSVFRRANIFRTMPMMYLLQTVANLAQIAEWYDSLPTRMFDTQLVPLTDPIRMTVQMVGEWAVSGDLMRQLVFQLSLWVYEDAAINVLDDSDADRVPAYWGQIFHEGQPIGVWHIGRSY